MTVYGTPVPQRRSRLLTGVVVAVVGLLGLSGAGAAAQLTRDLPPPELTTAIGASVRIPGAAPELPWPAQGAAEVMIEGLGRLGGSGDGPAEPIGSVAKVMTAYVILQAHPLSGAQEGPSLTVTAEDVADYRSRIATNQSLVPVKEGTALTQRDALEALMLPSANNVARQLAIWDAGSESAFVTKMNAAAAELGMADTRYTDPSGFLPTTVSTAADQVVLGRAAVKMPVFAEIVALEEATIPVAGRITNYNDLLGVGGVFGIKTGSTDEAGGNLLFASRLTVGSRTLTLVGAVFNQPGADTPQQLAAVNRVVRRLLTAIRKVVKEYQLLAAAPAGKLSSAWGATTTVTPAQPLTVIGWPGLELPVKIKDTHSGTAVTAGEQVGTAEAAGVRVQLRAESALKSPSLWWRLTRSP
ncbi:D-alanyl-D-alanine carboxypeptidase [Actinoplanes sp. NPDC024001]|uniref:D-alanyl-D-alanine carboxypeptidase family protein n=1 Tax=Actinoplanes sp. NPDC024001 TaxID=3154598 RepID=UPI0033CF164A